jgi:hypothetical protein
LFPRLGLFMLVTARKAGPATAADNGALVARG